LVQDGIEFWGQASFIKGGIAYANRINTVSPSYAQEITGKEFGCGMEGLLLQRRSSLSGILNGIDLQTWDPASDTYIAQNYTVDSIEKKTVNKLDLQKQFKLEQSKDTVVFGIISRLAVQKGIDIIIDAVEQLTGENFQLAVIGSGDSNLQNQLQALALAHPGRIAVEIGYNEQISHKIEAGADVFLMPSRYEPCGLNQMYSHRYGTLPLVTRVGGLADTVIDLNESKDNANGFVIDSTSTPNLIQGMQSAIKTYSDKKQWQTMQRNAMLADYSWSESASHYIDMYEAIVSSKRVSSG